MIGDVSGISGRGAECKVFVGLDVRCFFAAGFGGFTAECFKVVVDGGATVVGLNEVRERAPGADEDNGNGNDESASPATTTMEEEVFGREATVFDFGR